MTSSKALGFIFITLLIDCIGIGIIIPVMPSLIKELSGNDLSGAARWGGMLTFTYAVMQFIFAPIIGSLSDKFGRRPVLLVSLLGLGINYLLMAYSPTIYWLIVGRLIAGIGGASFTTANAYISDVSPPEKKAQNFGIVGAAFGLGFIAGPVIGGITGSYGTRVPFFVASALSLLNLLYGYFILPESLPPENRRAIKFKNLYPFASFNRLKKYSAATLLFEVLFLNFIAGHSTQSTWSYYTIEKFNWDERQVGYSLGFAGVAIALVQGGLIRVLIPKIGEKRALLLGLCMSITGNILFGLATSGWMMFVFMVPFSLNGLISPSIQSLLSNKISINEQGELQGVITGLMSLASIIGPLIMTNLFAYFTAKSSSIYLPGIPFYTAAVFVLISLILSIRAFKRVGSNN
jgi:DHA1 family tetracycline resistance protein-like MFS transporter